MRRNVVVDISLSLYLEYFVLTVMVDKGEVIEMLSDTDVVSSVVVDGKTYTVEWTVTVTEGASDAVKVAE